MDLSWIIIILSLLELIIIGGFSILRTYYQRKALLVQEMVLKESREYWNSWKERSQNIATEVKDEIKKEEIKLEERKESKRIKTRTRRDRNKTNNR